jgi:membrane protein implicated in regulation of membrane protease activity
MVVSLSWWAWAILGACVALAELHAPGNYLIWIALGAAATAAASGAFEMSLAAQIGIFAAASALSCLVGYFVYRGLNRPVAGDLALNQRNLHVVGAHGVVCEAIVDGRGKVRLGDSVWLAEGPDLPAGTRIAVTSVRGTLVVVAESPPAPTGRADPVRN